MNEKDAKTKWCPFTQVDTEPVAANRSVDGDHLIAGSFCLGARCMAWRWIVLDDPMTYDGTRLSTDDGYCGLAGSGGTR